MRSFLAAALAVALARPAGRRPSRGRSSAPAAAAIYQRLLPQIEQIKIFDHHAHPGFADDEEVDPAPVPPSAAPLAAASRPSRLGGGDAGAVRRDRQGAAQEGESRDRRTSTPILDRLGVETSVANRITMSDDLDPARFKWVFYIDPVLFPFDNAALAARNPDQAAFMPNQTKLVRAVQAAGGSERAAADAR